MQVAELIPDGQQGSAADSQGVSVGSLEQLLSKGLAIPLQLNSLHRLQAILQGHQVWESRMQQLLQGILVPAKALSLLAFCHLVLAQLEGLALAYLHGSLNPRVQGLQSGRTLPSMVYIGTYLGRSSA